MVAILKQTNSGAFYCSECRMSFSDPQPYCPFCGSIITNYEDIVTAAATKDFQDSIEDLKNE